MSESIDRIKYILDNVNNWLKFAESKNAALLIFNSALGFNLVRITTSVSNLNIHINYCLKVCVVFVAFSACLCLMSFVPIVKIPSLHQTDISEPKNQNFIFWNQIAKHTPETYRKALLKEKIIDKQESQQKFTQDICSQIVINSRIAVKKYTFFNIAIWMAVVPVVISVVLGLINFVLS